MTLPRSPGATSNSMMVAWSRSWARILTASASSTNDFATNSTSSFMSCRLPVAGNLLRLLQQRLDRRRKLRAFAHPVIDAFAVDLHIGWILLRIVMADLLDSRRPLSP